MLDNWDIWREMSIRSLDLYICRAEKGQGRDKDVEVTDLFLVVKITIGGHEHMGRIGWLWGAKGCRIPENNTDWEKETKTEQSKVPEDIQEPRGGSVSGGRVQQIPAQQGSRRFMSTGFGNCFGSKAGILISQGDSNSVFF